MVSCAPVIRAGYGGIIGQPIAMELSFLGLIMIMAFACLFTLVGVLIYVRQTSSAGQIEMSTSTNQSKNIISYSQLATFLICLGIPFAHVFVPLWYWKKHIANSDLRTELSNLLNFQITWTLFAVVAMMLCVVIVGIFLLSALVIFQWVTIIRAIRQTRRGHTFKYPMSLTFLPENT